MELKTDRIVDQIAKALAIVEALAETNSYELPTRGEALIEAARKLIKELRPN